MATPHETAAAAVTAALAALLAGSPTPTRDSDLPETCPPEGLVNLRFEDPVELGRQLGTGVREYSRIASVEIVAPGTDPVLRITRFEAILVAIGSLQGADVVGVDWLDVGAPVDGELAPIDGGETLRTGVVEITLFYQTATNPMEAQTWP